MSSLHMMSCFSCLRSCAHHSGQMNQFIPLSMASWLSPLSALLPNLTGRWLFCRLLTRTGWVQLRCFIPWTYISIFLSQSGNKWNDKMILFPELGALPRSDSVPLPILVKGRSSSNWLHAQDDGGSGEQAEGYQGTSDGHVRVRLYCRECVRIAK